MTRPSSSPSPPSTDSSLVSRRGNTVTLTSYLTTNAFPPFWYLQTHLNIKDVVQKIISCSFISCHCRGTSQVDVPSVWSPTTEAGTDMVGGSVWCGRTVSVVSLDCGGGCVMCDVCVVLCNCPSQDVGGSRW